MLTNEAFDNRYELLFLDIAKESHRVLGTNNPKGSQFSFILTPRFYFPDCLLLMFDFPNLKC